MDDSPYVDADADRKGPRSVLSNDLKEQALDIAVRIKSESFWTKVFSAGLLASLCAILATVAFRSSALGFFGESEVVLAIVRVFLGCLAGVQIFVLLGHSSK